MGFNTMTEWKYKLELEGKTLRSLINKEETMKNIIAIYNQIIVCLESLKKRLHKSDKANWEYDIESMIEDLQCACPDLKNNDGYYEEQKKSQLLFKEFL